MPESPDEIELLIARVADGDGEAAAELLDRHRSQLRQLIAMRLDTRIAARVDPSDIIQETLIEASQEMDRYIRERPLPFYPWLRQIALQRLMQVHRYHLNTQRRSVRREQAMPIHDRSGEQLAVEFAANECSPSHAAQQQETVRRVRAAIELLAARDREVLVLRYVERLSTSNAAAMIGITANTYAQRHVRALQKLRHLLDRDEEVLSW